MNTIKLISVFIATISMAILPCSCSSSSESLSDSVSISSFTRNENNFTVKINHNIETFSFIGKVSVPTGYNWKIYEDLKGTNEIITKTINCNYGDNKCFLLVFNDSETLGLYSVNV